MTRELDLMISGKLYSSLDSELQDLTNRAAELLFDYNNLRPSDFENQQRILKELLGHLGKNNTIKVPFKCDYGFNISLGKNFFANYNCIFLDSAPITIGDNVMMGPHVSLFTPGHPIDEVVRHEDLLEFAKPITIGNNCWFGGNVTVLPGISIGNNVVVAAGTIVTKDIPDDVIVAGNPSKILRKIDEDERQFWQAKRESYFKN